MKDVFMTGFSILFANFVILEMFVKFPKRGLK